jgi:hypothetical protein
LITTFARLLLELFEQMRVEIRIVDVLDHGKKEEPVVFQY